MYDADYQQSYGQEVADERYTLSLSRGNASYTVCGIWNSLDEVRENLRYFLLACGYGEAQVAEILGEPR